MGMSNHVRSRTVIDDHCSTLDEFLDEVVSNVDMLDLFRCHWIGSESHTSDVVFTHSCRPGWSHIKVSGELAKEEDLLR